MIYITVAIILCLGLVAVQKTHAQYVVDNTANELVREDFNVEGKPTELCAYLSPEWHTTGQDNGRQRVYWLKATEEFKDLKGMEELRLLIRHGEYTEIYKCFKDFPEDIKKKAFIDNPNLEERDITWLRDNWRLI